MVQEIALFWPLAKCVENQSTQNLSQKCLPQLNNHEKITHNFQTLKATKILISKQMDK